jgi:hypothetical protein
MDARSDLLGGGRACIGLPSVNSEEFVRPPPLAAPQIDFPAPDLCDLLGFLEALFTVTQGVFALPALIDIPTQLLEHASESATEFSDFIVSRHRHVDRQVVGTPDALELAGQDTERSDDCAVHWHHDQAGEHASLDEEPQETQTIDVG